MIVSSLHKAEKTQDIGKESRYWNTELRAWSLAYDRALSSKPLTSEPGVGLRDHEVHCPLSNRVPGPTLIPGGPGILVQERLGLGSSFPLCSDVI